MSKGLLGIGRLREDHVEVVSCDLNDKMDILYRPEVRALGAERTTSAKAMGHEWIWPVQAGEINGTRVGRR